MRLLYGGWGAGLLDGGTRARVCWVGTEVYMGVYYANLSFVEFRAMILGITCTCTYHSSKLYKT